MKLDPNAPATLAQLVGISSVHAQGVGLLLGLALAQISPDALARFHDAVSMIPNNGTDRDAFIDCALEGIEIARYDLNPGIDS